MINRVILVGNLTRDAESIATSGRAMTTMRLATNSRWRNGDGIMQESVEFHSIVAFGRLAETAAAYCQRGRRVYIEGRLRTRQYDSSNGDRRTKTEIIVETLRLLQPRADSGSDGDAASGEMETPEAFPAPVVGPSSAS